MTSITINIPASSQFEFCPITGYLGVTREALMPNGKRTNITRALPVLSVDLDAGQIANLDWFGICPYWLINDWHGLAFPQNSMPQPISKAAKLGIYKNLGVYTHERLFEAIGDQPGDFDRAQEWFNKAGAHIEWFLLRQMPHHFSQTLWSKEDFAKGNFGTAIVERFRLTKFVTSYINLRERGEI